MYFHMLQNLNKQNGTSFFKKNFVDLGSIGSGQFGQVIKVMHRISDINIQEYAVKRITVGESKPWLLKALQEVSTLQKLHHPNIIQYHYCWVENMKTAINLDDEIPNLFILLDYAKGGSLVNLKPQMLGRILTQSEFLHILKQAALGLQHLHSVGFLSRDVKPSNFLLSNSNIELEPPQYIHQIFGTSHATLESMVKAKEWKTDKKLQNQVKQRYFIQQQGITNLQVLLTDFGQQGDGIYAGTEIMTAPEVFQTQKHTKQSDIYSLALTMLILVTEQEELEDYQQYQLGLISKFQDVPYSKEVFDLIGQMLCSAPNRITCEEIIAKCDKLIGSQCTDIVKLTPTQAHPKITPPRNIGDDITYLQIVCTIILIAVIFLVFK